MKKKYQEYSLYIVENNKIHIWTELYGKFSEAPLDGYILDLSNNNVKFVKGVN